VPWTALLNQDASQESTKISGERHHLQTATTLHLLATAQARQS